MAEREEVDEGTIELGKLARKILTGKNRKSMLKLAAEEEGMTIPEVESERQIELATKPLHEKIAKLEEGNANSAALAALEARRAPAKERGYTGEKLKQLEQFMIDKKIGDYIVAIEVMERAASVAQPRTGGRNYEPPTLPTDTDGTLFKNPSQWRNKVAHQVIDDIRSGKAV